MIALLITGLVSIFISIGATPFFVAWLRDRGVGQQIRQDGPSKHLVKAGTPTIGGACIVVAALIAYAVAHYRTVYTIQGLLVMFAIVGTAVVGFADDWIKVRNGRSLGLTSVQKLTGQVVVALTFAVLAVQYTAVNTNLSWARYDSIDFDLTKIGWVIFAVVVMVATANAVNLTDGLDGLAAGAASFAFSTFAVIGFWQLRNSGIYTPPGFTPNSLDLAIVAVAMAGACVGFLCWNAAPARIFMGDTGSLAIGAGLAALALMLNVHLLLAVICGLFVIETLSVIIQVVSFRFFKRRVFRMAPIHHHFELKGWPETHVIIRFWIVAGLFTALGLGLFYADFLTVAELE